MVEAVPEIFSVDQGVPSPAQQKVGERLMHRADVWTDLRSDSAIPLAIAVALSDEGMPIIDWAVTAEVGGSMVTDALDGHDARKGAEILGIKTTPEGAMRDQLADKKLTNWLMIGLFARSVRLLRPITAGVIGANYLVTQQRDRRMARNRALVTEHGLDEEELKARFINKAKTAGQDGALETLISPLAKDWRVRAGALAALSASTGLGLIGEKKVRKRVEGLVALKEGADHSLGARLS